MFFKEILINLFEKPNKVESISWGDYIVQNFCEILEIVLNYITNTLSFVRVGAYVLVHAGMMGVVVLLAETFPIIFLPIMIMGNTIVIVMEASLAGIQVLRLEFYELFNKFFQGQGREFKPISINCNNK
jgi:V/A-type H+-transporting ATPase subunit I